MIYPTQDASTVAGQVEWFMCGFVYSAVIGTTALMIRIFKQSGKEGTDI